MDANWIEIVGFVTGLACVWLNAKQHVWAWPIAMVSVVLYGFVFYEAKLYGDMVLQLFFFVLICYGWYKWVQKDAFKQELKPSRSTPLTYVYSVAFVLFCTGLLTGALDQFTDSDMPFLDAFTTSLSIVAQVLLARKKLFNWTLWIVADVIYVGMYFYKGLNLTAGLYLIFIPLAYYGFIAWRREIDTPLIIPTNAQQQDSVETS